MEENKLDNLDLYGSILKNFHMEAADVRTVSPLTFAYIGDCIYDLVIRSVVIGKGNMASGALHNKTTAIVRAQSQRESFERIEGLLTDEEIDIYKRGRNAKTHTSAKNASKADYHVATGFETLMGYLYMTGRIGRMLELIKAGID